MADALQVFQPIFPPGNGATNVGTLATPLGLSIVRRILMTFPPGCGGLVGVQIRAGNGFAFPNQAGEFVTFDDYTYAFDVDNQIDSGQWSIAGYNRDFIEHEVQVVYEFDYLRGNVGTSNNSQPIAL